MWINGPGVNRMYVPYCCSVSEKTAGLYLIGIKPYKFDRYASIKSKACNSFGCLLAVHHLA